MRSSKTLRGLGIGLLAMGGLSVSGCWFSKTTPEMVVADAVTVTIFGNQGIQYSEEEAQRYASTTVSVTEGGRVVTRTVALPEFSGPVQIFAHVRTKPMPADSGGVCDKWDRAGNVRLVVHGSPDLEVVKFITAYGGASTHRVDVSHLAPLLRGTCTFRGFIDTWVSPAWRIDFSLEFVELQRGINPDWIKSLIYEENITEERMTRGPISAAVMIPEEAGNVYLNYLVSGHCTDGTDADEFVSKDNVILVDGQEVYRFKPWREDCRQFRALNPYCRRWPDGSWSSDFSRSGWCPSDKVRPIRIDLTKYLDPGQHIISFYIEGIRPMGPNDHYGYWRASAYLMGWNNRHRIR